MSKALLGFIAGAAVGALAGVLYAPDKGEATRKKIKDKSGDISDSLKASFDEFTDTVKNTFSRTKDEAEEIHDKAQAKMTATRNDVKNALS